MYLLLKLCHMVGASCCCTLFSLPTNVVFFVLHLAKGPRFWFLNNVLDHIVLLLLEVITEVWE
jgi:hypothetical protein